jgi:hypothetical protein
MVSLVLSLEDKLASIYGFNWNSTNPAPPPISSFTRGTSYFVFVVSVIGFVFSVALLCLISMLTVRNTHGDNENKAKTMLTRAIAKAKTRAGFRAQSADMRKGQGLQLKFVALTLATGTAILCRSVQVGRVHDIWECQLQACVMHTMALSQFGTLMMSSVERYYSLLAIARQKPGLPPLWSYLKFGLWPFFLLHSLLPIATSATYGAYGMMPNSATCLGVSGQGVPGHDAFVLINLGFFVVCMGVMIFTGYKSFLLIKSIVGKAAKSKKGRSDQENRDHAATKIERTALLFNIALITTFLFTWAPAALFFLLSPFKVGFVAEARFHDANFLALSVGTSLSPLIHLYFDKPLKTIFMSYLLTGSKVLILANKRKKSGSVAPKDHVELQRRERRSYDLNANCIVSAVSIDISSGSSMTSSDPEGRLYSLNLDQVARNTIKEELFSSLRPAEFGKEELHNLDRAQSFVDAVTPLLKPRKQSNSLVTLESCAAATVSSPQVLKAKVEVRATVEEIAAFIHHFTSNYYTEACQRDGMTQDRILLPLDSALASNRSTTTYTRYSMPGGRYRDRSFCSLTTCGSVRESDGSVLYASFDAGRSTSYAKDHVAGSATSVFVITPDSTTSANTISRTPTSILELYTHLDFKTKSTKYIYDQVCRPLTVRTVSQIQRYFQNLQPLDELDARGAIALATTLLDSMIAFHIRGTKRDRKSLAKMALASMFERSAAMREARVKYAWLPEMLQKLLERRLRFSRKVQCGLADISDIDAYHMGNSMGMIMLGNVTADAAVDEWMRSYPVMAEFESEQPWFRSFVITIVARNLATAEWGMHLRVYLGALLATSDTVSDILVIIEYLSLGRNGIAWATIAMVLCCMLLHVLIVWTQNKGHTRQLATEVALTVLMMKPANDAWKLASGKEQELHHKMDPLTEAVISRGIEMFTESIPGKLNAVVIFVLFAHTHSLALSPPPQLSNSLFQAQSCRCTVWSPRPMLPAKLSSYPSRYPSCPRVTPPRLSLTI